MTKEKREQISNRLVLNFGLLLLGALLMLYVRSAIMSTFSKIAYIVILILGILGLASAIALFVVGKSKKPRLRNYSAVGLGVFVVSALVYLSKLNLFSFYTKNIAVATVYIAMLVYFIIMAIYTAVMLKKPLVKDPVAAEKAKALKKKKKKRK